MDEEDKGQYDKISEREFCDDIYWLVTKKLYKEIGGYSPIFYMESEDFEWQLRAKERGYKIFYTPYAKAWHRVSYALGRDSVKKIYYDARNPTIAIMLHASPRQFNIYLIEHLRCTIRRFLSLMKHLRFYAAVKCMQGFISGVLWGVGHKKLTLAHFI
jgi:GT2 family glycosyltransferase